MGGNASRTVAQQGLGAVGPSGFSPLPERRVTSGFTCGRRGPDFVLESRLGLAAARPEGVDGTV